MHKNNVISEKTKKELYKIAYQITDIRNELRLGTASLTPVNYIDEMDKFFKSETYNPQYIYKEKRVKSNPKQINDIKKQIENLYIPGALKEHIQSVLDDHINLYNTKATIGKEEFSEHAHKLFNWGTDRLDILLAKTPQVHFQMHIPHKIQTAEKIKERFDDVLEKYGIASFTTKIDTFSTHMINVGIKTIGIGSAIRRYKCNVDRLIIHEIESHALQNENIRLSKNPLTELSKYGNSHLFSEGLAVFNELASRKITPSAYEMYYNRIKAVRLLNKSFREIFDALSLDLPAHKAFVMTYRVKRGLADTKKPGGFPKDAAYLLGYHEIESLINKGFSKKLLYATKSPILTTLLMKYNLLNEDKLITPKFLK